MSVQDQGNDSRDQAADFRRILEIAHEMNTSVQVLAMNLGFLRKSHVRMSMLLGLHRACMRHYPEGVADRLQRAEEELDLEFFLGETPKVMTESGEGAAKVVEAIQVLRGIADGRMPPPEDGASGEGEPDERGFNVI